MDMRVLAVCVVAAILAIAPVCAGEKDEARGWKTDLTGGLKLTQASFGNWEEGGDNTLAWQVNASVRTIGILETSRFETSLRLGYGMARVGEEASRKSLDEIWHESVLTRHVGIFLEPFVAVSWETRFSRSYRYDDAGRTAVSDFMDPAYFTQSAGVSCSFRNALTSRLGISAKETVTDEFAGTFADDPGTSEVEKTRAQLGLESVTHLELRLGDNLEISSGVILFSDFESARETDIKWTSLVTARAAKYVDVSLGADLLYDSDISSKFQFRQVLALGLAYSRTSE